MKPVSIYEPGQAPAGCPVCDAGHKPIHKIWTPVLVHGSDVPVYLSIEADSYWELMRQVETAQLIANQKLKAREFRYLKMIYRT